MVIFDDTVQGGPRRRSLDEGVPRSQFVAPRSSLLTTRSSIDEHLVLQEVGDDEDGPRMQTHMRHVATLQPFKIFGELALCKRGTDRPESVMFPKFVFVSVSDGEFTRFYPIFRVLEESIPSDGNSDEARGNPATVLSAHL